MSTASVNTKKVEGRRTVRYDSLQDLWKEAEHFAKADVRTLGNWSKGQIYKHLALAMEMSIDGGKVFPAPIRFVLNLLFKRKLLTKGIPAGFSAPANFVAESEITTEEGLEALRRAIARQGEVSQRALHPGFGKFSREEWEQFHLRHAEMHMSFIAE